MKLPKEVKSIARQTVINHLRGKRRMKQLGSGAFARVFGRTSCRRVIKVGDGYDKYLKYISIIGKENPNPYFPTIYSIERRRHQKAGESWRDSYYIVEMEKLTKWGKVPAKVRDRLLSKLGCDNVWEADRPNIDGSSGRWEKEAVRSLRKLWSKYGVGRDVHQNNVMFRRVGKGWQLVYTDPAA